MAMRTMTVQEIDECVARIRSVAASGWTTNYFKQPLIGSTVEALESDKALVFLERDRDFDHLYFATADVDSLAPVLSALDSRPITIDYLTRSSGDAAQSAIESAGFSLRAKYVHISAPMPKVPVPATPTEFAVDQDAAEILERMPRDLDRYCDHFPTLEGMREMIADKRVLAHHVDGAIAGYFIFQFTGVRAHLNYWYTEKSIGPAKSIDLILRCYAEMAKRGVKYVYAWVNSTNAKVLNIHARFGLKFDGLYDFIYQRGIDGNCD